MVVLSIEGGKRELTPWFYIVEFTLGFLPGNLASRFREITCAPPRLRVVATQNNDEFCEQPPSESSNLRKSGGYYTDDHLAHN